MDQLASHAARYHYMTGGRVTVPMVMRNKFATRAGGGPSHSSCNHGAFIHFPGLKIIMPTTPADAKGLLLAAIRDPNPVLCFESHHLYGERGPVPEGDYTVPIGVAVVQTLRKRSHDRHLRRHGFEGRRRCGAIERKRHRQSRSSICARSRPSTRKRYSIRWRKPSAPSSSTKGRCSAASRRSWRP